MVRTLITKIIAIKTVVEKKIIEAKVVNIPF